MTLEPFIYLFVFLVLSFLTFFARWLSQRVQQEIDMSDIVRSPESPKASQALKAPGAQSPSKEVAPPTPMKLRAPGISRRSFTIPLHHKRDLRQGIVLMTILGPCRALDPPS